MAVGRYNKHKNTKTACFMGRLDIFFSRGMRSDVLLAAAWGAVGDGVAGLRLAPGAGSRQHAAADHIQEGSGPGDEDG